MRDSAMDTLKDVHDVWDDFLIKLGGWYFKIAPGSKSRTNSRHYDRDWR
jgi:hypothetical protein